MARYERIVSLAPSNTEILYALGVEARVVATTSICDVPPEAERKASVGGWTNPDIEEVKEHEPDLVLASDELQDRAVEECRDAGLEVRQLKPTAFHDVFNSVKTVGELVEKADEARELVERMNEDVKELAAANGSRTRVYCEEWHDPPMVGGNWIPRMVRIIGGDYLIDEWERSRKVSAEEVQEFDPEHVFLHYCGFGDSAEEEQVTDREAWDEITAVRNGNIHVIDDSLLNRPGPRLLEGLNELKEAIHGSEQSRT